MTFDDRHGSDVNFLEVYQHKIHFSNVSRLINSKPQLSSDIKMSDL